MIDEVRIDSDEGGFTLELVGDFSDPLARYAASDDASLLLRLPQDAAIQLLAQARKWIGPWAAEMDAARRDYVLRAVGNIEDERAGLDVDDPDHPDYRERLADIGDARRKRIREVL